MTIKERMLSIAKMSMKSNAGLVRLLEDNLHIVRERDKLRKA